MRILVTGGAGFIGSNYVHHVLATSDDTVTILDALTYAGLQANLASFDGEPRVRFVHGDVCDRDQVATAMADARAVVHFAAESHVDRSLLDPAAFSRTNCVGTEVVCQTATSLGVDRVVHVSTDEVYGSIARGSFTEADPLQPSSPYSASKAAADLIALTHHEAEGLPVMVTRSSNAFGPRQHLEKMIPLFITTIHDGGDVPIYGDGGHVRDWLWVEDNCRAIDLVLRRGQAGEIYNIGAGNERRTIDVAGQLLSLMGVSPERLVHIGDRPNHDRRYSVDSTKVHRLGWSISLPFEDALAEAVRWYVSNEAWWRPLLPQLRALRVELDAAFAVAARP